MQIVPRGSFIHTTTPTHAQCFARGYQKPDLTHFVPPFAWGPNPNATNVFGAALGGVGLLAFDNSKVDFSAVV